jgi:hypothetical protein
VPQDRAYSSQPWYGRLTRQEIALGIPLDDCEPLAGEVVSPTAYAYVGPAQSVCFRVARVAFLFNHEERDALTAPIRAPIDYDRAAEQPLTPHGSPRD